MTIKRRLIMLFSLLSMIIVTVTVIGGWSLYRADLNAARVYHHRVTTMHRLTILSDFYAEDIIKLTTRLAAGRTTLDLSLPEIRQARDAAAALWQDYRSHPLAGTEMMLSQEIEASMRDIDLQIEALAAAQSDADIKSLIAVEIEPYIDRLSTLFASLADQQLIAAETDYRNAHRAFAWGLAGVLAATAGAIVSLAFVVLMVIQWVTKPLRKALMQNAATGWALSPGNVDADEIGAVIATLGEFQRSLSDVATQYDEQQRLAKSFRAQLEAIFRHAPVGVYMKDLDGRILMISDAAARLWGHRHDEMIGKLDTSWSPPSETATIRDSNRQVVETGEAVTVEYRGDPGDPYDWLLTVKFPVRDASGKVVSIGGFDIDISEHKRREEDLRLASAHLLTGKRLAKIYYWSRRVDARTGRSKTYDMDPELLRLTGRPDLSEDNQTYATQVIHPDDRARILEVYQNFEDGKIDQYQVEYRLRRADGSHMPIRAWVERMRDPATGDFLVVGVVQDIGLEKQREAQLTMAKVEAETSDRAKSEFLTNMSHELRTPLNAVIGYSDLLKLNEIVRQNPQLANYVEAVNDSGRNLLEIINAILDMARLESSDRSLQESTFVVAEVIGEVERLVGAQAVEKGVALHFPRIGGGMAGTAGKSGDAGVIDPDLKIRAELRAFRQALMNILSNAIKFTSQGGAVTLAPCIRHNGDLAITITDTGIGIDANLIPFLTLPFTQAGSAWTRRKGGIGLGLAITKKLLDLHQGKIEVASRFGEGTRITLIFPATRLAWKEAEPTTMADPIAAQSLERSSGKA